PGAGRTAERRAGSIVGNQVQCLRWIIRSRTWLAHFPLLKEITFYLYKTIWSINLSPSGRIVAGLALVSAAGCGPHAHIPARPTAIPGAVEASDSGAVLARALAPLLYTQRDEWFPLERVVAVLHPTRPIIAYQLLWRDDVHGSWIPFTVPTDEEVLWVGYDSSHVPTDLWTYWHGRILHTPWPRSQVRIDVQWGKHGSLP